MYDKYVCILRIYGYTYFICYYHSIIKYIKNMCSFEIFSAKTIQIYNYYPVAGYKITYSVATLSYDNYYVNLLC